jgi:histone H3/H4
MSDDDKQPYQARAIVERERVTAATEAWKKAAAVAAGKNITTTSRMMNRNNLDDSIRDTNKTRDNGLAAMVLPVGRVRKICRLDPDVRGISKEALLLITKATEMVTVQLGQECIKTAHIQNRRTLLPQDVVDVCNIRESFFFLKDDITDLHRQQQKLLQAKSHQNGGVGTQRRGSSHGSSSSSTVAATSKTLTDYFKPLT